MAASYVRARAVILSIDSAKVSGVVLSEPHIDGRGSCSGYEANAFGIAKTQKDREAWALEAKEAAEDLELPLVIVGEEWTPHGLSRSAYVSLCESWGLWVAAFLSTGIDVKKCVVRAKPNTWRAAVFGKKRPKTRIGLKKLAVVYAERQLELPPKLQDDIAEAACLRVWAERAPEVHKLLAAPKKKQRKKVA